MKKFSSIKVRITVWYTGLMIVMISLVLVLTGMFSYSFTIDNIEKDLKLQVTQIAEKVKVRTPSNVYFSVANNEEFKNVSIYNIHTYHS